MRVAQLVSDDKGVSRPHVQKEARRSQNLSLLLQTSGIGDLVRRVYMYVAIMQLYIITYNPITQDEKPYNPITLPSLILQVPPKLMRSTLRLPPVARVRRLAVELVPRFGDSGVPRQWCLLLVRPVVVFGAPVPSHPLELRVDGVPRLAVLLSRLAVSLGSLQRQRLPRLAQLPL